MRQGNLGQQDAVRELCEMPRLKSADLTDTELLDFIESMGNGAYWEFDVSWSFAGGAFLKNTHTRSIGFAQRTVRLAIARAIERNQKRPLWQPGFSHADKS
jgi:hypothetical protein